MKGLIIKNCNARHQPYLMTPNAGVYNEGDIVEVVGATEGKDIDTEPIWYKLSTGEWVWSGAVHIAMDGSDLRVEDRNQFLISYRQRDENGRPDLDPKTPARKLYFGSIVIPADPEFVQVQELSPQQFAQQVLNLVAPIPSEREHVVIYIHGYQVVSSLKLDLLSGFAQSYLTHPNNKIAKVLFFAWPSQGWITRKSVDDRSINAGERFTANGLFEYLNVLSLALKDAGRKLNLLVHSFGHQLLNGMLNPHPDDVGRIPAGKIFQNIFLMAPDITHLALKVGGDWLHNNFPNNGKDTFFYNFSKLKQLAHCVHVFHDKYDYLLHVSSKKSLEKGMRRSPDSEEVKRIKEYRAIGNYGNKMLPEDQREPDFRFWDVEELIMAQPGGDLYDFPFLPARKGVKRSIDKLWDNLDYSAINDFQGVLNLGRSADHHRYVFTCKQVVDKVQDLL
jgi:hypothetical protein